MVLAGNTSSRYRSNRLIPAYWTVSKDRFAAITYQGKEIRPSGDIQASIIAHGQTLKTLDVGRNKAIQARRARWRFRRIWAVFAGNADSRYRSNRLIPAYGTNFDSGLYVSISSSLVFWVFIISLKSILSNAFTAISLAHCGICGILGITPRIICFFFISE